LAYGFVGVLMGHQHHHHHQRYSTSPTCPLARTTELKAKHAGRALYSVVCFCVVDSSWGIIGQNAFWLWRAKQKSRPYRWPRSLRNEGKGWGEREQHWEKR